jgi:hypothetical protein
MPTETQCNVLKQPGRGSHSHKVIEVVPQPTIRLSHNLATLYIVLFYDENAIYRVYFYHYVKN